MKIINSCDLSIIIIIIIIIINFLDRFSRSELKRSLHHLYHIVTNFPEICAFIIGFSFTVLTKSAKKSTETSKRMLTKFVSIGSYSPEVRSFDTLITSTKVFSLLICKTI